MFEIKKFPKEIPIYVTAFEHVFPGNKFINTRKGSPLEYLTFFATTLMDYNYVNGIIIPDPDAGSLIHRIPFENPSQVMINYYLGKATKLVSNYSPSVSLIEILGGNVILGGTIETRSSIPSLGMGGNVVWVTGVMNEENQPKDLIAHKFFKKPLPLSKPLISHKYKPVPAF